MDANAPDTNAPSDAPDATGITVDLNIISPNAAVLRPLSFGLHPTTTIRTVKHMIRQNLPIRPTDDQQRLIYKGRALDNDDLTLGQVMGIDTVSLGYLGAVLCIGLTGD
jgi:ubiquitin domain-containing protein